jgi:hypothetical protein
VAGEWNPEPMLGFLGPQVKIYVKDFNLGEWLERAEEAQKPK